MVNLKTCPKIKSESLKRNWKNLDIEEFKLKVANINWDSIYNISDVNLAYYFLESNLRQILDELIPILKVQPSGRKKRWISTQTQEEIKLRDGLRAEAVRTDSTEDWDKFRKCRNRVTDLVKKDKKVYMDKLYSNADLANDSKSLYRISKEQLGWNLGGQPTSLNNNGKWMTKPVDIANILNKYFKDKVVELKRGIPSRNKDPLETLRNSMKRWNGLQYRQDFKLREVTLAEVCNIIRELKNSNTMGFDEIDARTVKLVASSLYKPIQYVLNLSITSQVYCNRWKFGKLLPLWKGVDDDRYKSKG